MLSFEVAYSLPAGTRTLAELGAEVVRVAGPGRDSFYISVVDGVYMSKPCFGINLKDPEGLAIAKRMAALADVVCSNFVPGVMERLGLSPDELRRLNPKAIVLQLSGYGSPGPWSGYPAFGPSTEAAGGMNLLVGPEDGPPVRIGSGVFSDQLAGRFAALGIVAALEQRQRTGEGRYIDLSMTEAISLLVGHTVVAAGLGDEPARLGNRDRDFVPQGIYPAKGEDEWVAISVKDDSQWAALVRLLGDAAGSLARAALDSAKGRHANHDEVDTVISAWTRERDKNEAAELLQKFGIAASPVQKSRDPLFDQHLKQRGLFQEVQHERPILGFAAHPHPTTPWFAAGHARHQLRDLHFHGADNARIFDEWLGMSAEEVARLETAGTLIVIKEPEVEDRRTSYRDEDWAEQLGLTPESRSSPLSRDDGVRRVGGEGRRASKYSTAPLRVLEVSKGPAAAFAGMLLSRLGHDVAQFHPRFGPRGQTALLSPIEWGFLDSGKRENNDTRSVAATADVVLEDVGAQWVKGVLGTSSELRAMNRNLIVASISPYGLTGPKRGWQASELTIQASSGPLHSTGWADGVPQKAGGFPAHYIAGINAATAILARAYGVRAGTCNGGRIDVSMQECYLHHWTRHIGEWAYSGTKMRRERPGFGHQGFRHTAVAKDGWLYVLALYATWEEIALFFGLEGFLGPEWSSPEYRMEHWPEIEGPYLESLGRKSRYEWFAEGSAAGYTFAPVHSAKDQFTNVQFAARGFLKDAEVDGRTVPTPGLPFPWDESATSNRPEAGQ